jgi:cation transport ATPase
MSHSSGRPMTADPEQADPQQADPEQANTEQANTEQANTEQANTEQANTEQANTEQAEPGERRTNVFVAALLTLRFATELAWLAVLAGAALDSSAHGAGRIVLAIALPVLAAFIWGAAFAPRARRRLADPLRLVAEIVLFATSAAGLALTGHPVPAVIFGVAAIGTAILLRWQAPGS